MGRRDQVSNLRFILLAIPNYSLDLRGCKLGSHPVSNVLLIIRQPKDNDTPLYIHLSIVCYSQIIVSTLRL